MHSQKIFCDVLQIHLALPTLPSFLLQREKCMVSDKGVVKVPESPVTAAGVWQSVSLTVCGQVFVQDLHTCTHEYTPSVIFIHAHTHVYTHTHLTLAHTHPIQYSSRHKRGKTCRHGRLSKQLQQIETKLNLKPRATLATERLWQIWQGRKGSAVGPKGGRDDGENGRCGSQRKRELLG